MQLFLLLPLWHTPQNTAGESHVCTLSQPSSRWSYPTPIRERQRDLPSDGGNEKGIPRPKLGEDFPGENDPPGNGCILSPLMPRLILGRWIFQTSRFGWDMWWTCSLEGLQGKQLRDVVTWFMMAWWLEVLEGEWYDFGGGFTLLCLWQMRFLARKVQNMLSPRFAIFLFLAQIQLIGFFMYFI